MSESKMKPILKVVIFVTVMLFALFFYMIFSNETTNRSDNAEIVQQLFGGEHSLQKLKPDEYDEEKWEASGGFFILLGGFSGTRESDKKRELILSWKMHNGKYCISRVPLDKVYVKIDNSIKSPYVIFEINKKVITSRRDDYEWYKANDLLETELIPAITIVCKEEHWEKRIEMPFDY